MKVSELIDLLQDEDPDMEVHFAAPSHDYWKTTLAPAARSVTTTRISHSAYHQDWKIADHVDDDKRLVVLIE